MDVYQTIPKQVVAHQFDGTPTGAELICNWINTSGSYSRASHTHVECGNYEALFVDTGDKRRAAGRDYFIIQGAEEFDVMTPDEFERTYERLEVK